jgi:hypothetical protein
LKGKGLKGKGLNMRNPTPKARPVKYPATVAMAITGPMVESIERLLKAGHASQSVLLREFLHRGLAQVDPLYRQQTGG